MRVAVPFNFICLKVAKNRRAILLTTKFDLMNYPFAKLVLAWLYTPLTNLSTRYLVMCKVYNDVCGIK